jgi:hypothetical protein
MDLIKSLLGFLFKLFVIGLVLFTILIVIIAVILKRDVDDIKEFTESLKRKDE